MNKYLRSILPIVLLICSQHFSRAFSPDFYASQSVLASGNWVKIRIERSGLYQIPASTLRSWGFSDPSRVKIYGYGGRRIDDNLSEATFVDDLPPTPSVASSSGVVFYGAGSESWLLSTGNNYHGYLNPYSSHGYYFVTESDTPSDIPTVATPGASSPATIGRGRVHYEPEAIQATKIGPLFVGESFSSPRTRSYTITTPGRTKDSEVWMECSFFHTHKGGTSRLSFSVDATTLPAVSTDNVSAMSESSYAHGAIAVTRHTFVPGGSDTSRFNLSVTYSPTVNSFQAYLDYLSFNYDMDLTIPASGMIEFWSNSNSLAVSANETIKVWDVTDPANIMAVNTSYENGSAAWSAPISGMRCYVAWTSGASLPAPTFDNRLSNQNLHGQAEPSDMVIITPNELMTQANRLADIHRRADKMTVTVVDQEKIYNEFSSGTCDISGLRKYLKMIFDLGVDSDHPLKYVTLLGRPTLDQRRLTPNHPYSYKTTPWWVVRDPRLSMSENDGFGTDDFLAMLQDNSGTQLGIDQISVAVGRMPFLTANEGNTVLDKLEQYMNSSKKTGWKNNMIVVADDEDEGVHLAQAENMTSLIEATPMQQMLANKIYIDAYKKVGNEVPEAHDEMFRLLNDGAAWWIFTGHANNHSWTAESMLTYNDINNMYMRNLPFLLAATCNFLQWDGAEISGGEIMYKERYGGAIGMISASRPVYISDNGLFLAAFGRQVASRDNDGRMLRAGDVYRRTKNDIRNNNGNITSNTNRLRFVFMGDPAMNLVIPDNIIEITAINGIEPTEENQVTIAALSNATISGRIVSADGATVDSFNGVVTVDLFDAERSITTLGHNDGTIDVFDRHGEKLLSASATVANGTFEINVAMPSQIADNFRNATMSLYAYATDSNDEAAGVFKQFYVYGLDEPETPDTEAPVIESIVLNHSGFSSGDTVNDSPMLIAKVSDNVSLNLSNAGIGQMMTITVDDFDSHNDVSSYYIPSADGSPSGVINYPLSNLTEGHHTLKLRVFDTSGNTAARSIDFKVSTNIAPDIFEVFTDANPAHTAASFYVRHNRPESIVDVEVTVYNLLGQPIWTGSTTGMSDMDVSAPVTWNLCDSTGSRVQRGIYLYRATITDSNGKHQSAARRLAVAAH